MGWHENEVRRQLGKWRGVGAQPHRLGVSSRLSAEIRDSVVVVVLGLGFENRERRMSFGREGDGEDGTGSGNSVGLGPQRARTVMVGQGPAGKSI